jgi:hypothetical protein
MRLISKKVKKGSFRGALPLFRIPSPSPLKERRIQGVRQFNGLSPR